MAIAAGRKLADRLFGVDARDRIAKVSYDLVPTVVFSHPVSIIHHSTTASPCIAIDLLSWSRSLALYAYWHIT
jgi:hypothetical protein